VLDPIQLPPEIASRFNELGISFEQTPWIWIRTLDPIRKQADTVCRIIAHLPTANGLTIWSEDQSSPLSQAGFGPEWDHHYYEAVGVLRCFNHAGGRFVAAPDNLPGQPPLWEAAPLGTHGSSITAALWWQRAWRLTSRGIPPTLIAELRWWPGLIGAQPFFRPTTEVDQSIDTGHLRAAERARTLLYGLRPNLGSTGRPRFYDESNEAQFFEVLEEAVHRVAQSGDRVNPSTLQQHGFMDRRTITATLERLKYDLDALAAEAHGCSRGGGRNICTVHVRRRAKFRKNRV
jgi:hypothetical protein